MVQHDYVIANDSASQVRADINNALSAIASNNSGATEPSTTYAYMFWYDTNNNTIKMRNSANDAWISLFELDQSGDLVDDLTITDLTISNSLTNTLIRMVPYRVENIAFTESGGTITMHDADGGALSASNPGYVCMPSNQTPGQLVLHTITSNQAMTITEMNGNLLGTTASTAYGNSRPLYTYFCADDNDANIKIFFGALPHLKKSPADTEIGDPSAANADNSYSLYSWDDITETSYDDNNCFCCGSLTVTKNSSDVWAFDSMVEGKDGIGLFNEDTLFQYPAGHHGAASGTYFLDNGGQAPVFSSNNYWFAIKKDGEIKCKIYLSGDGGTDGTGAVDAKLAIPYESDIEPIYYDTGAFVFQDPTNGVQIGVAELFDDSQFIYLVQGDGSYIDNGDFTNGARRVAGTVSYRAK